MAAQNPRQSAAEAVPDESQLRDFLLDNPDFFQRHPDLLRTLHIPHGSGDAVSLVERQVSVLGERNVDLRHRLKELTDAARENETLYVGTRALVLSLLEAADLPDLLARFEHGMAEHFDTPYAALVVYGEGPTEGACRCADRAAVEAHLGSLLRGGKPACGALRTEEFGYLFPGARGAGSAALVPLDFGGDRGLVAVGSDDAKRYHSQMGTLFLEHLAAVIGRVLARLDREGASAADA
jgi:uncharacterized protein YigA (DUF484 family)